MRLLRKKIAQMLIMGFPDAELSKDSLVYRWIKEEGIGGVLLFDYHLPLKKFGKNLINVPQIKKLTHDLHALDPSLWIAIDYEGGHVDRLQKIAGCPATKTPLAQAQLSEAARFEEMNVMVNTLRDLGFNLNFSPVVDLNLNQHEGIIGRLHRSFSDNPKEVVRLATQWVEQLNAAGIVGCYKHFPGHGSAVGDTHEGFVDVTQTFTPQELEPFALLASSSQHAMIMTAHVINKKLDPSGLPATLSYPLLTELLRQKLGFQGVIVSDDLQMHAISHHYSLADAVRMTIHAGADMMIFGNQLGSHTATEVIDCIEAQVLKGEIDASIIDAAFDRMSALKQSIGERT